MPEADTAISRMQVIILAAGESNRFGSPKQLARVHGESLIHRATEAATALVGRNVTIVLGAHSRLVESELVSHDAQAVLNAEWRDGLASSVRKGMITVPPAMMAVLLMSCDMPLVDGALLRQIADLWAENRSKILFCESKNGAGLPAIVPRRYFKALMSIKGDPGINSFFARHKSLSMAINPPQVQFDIDTPEDLATLEKAG